MMKIPGQVYSTFFNDKSYLGMYSKQDVSLFLRSCFKAVTDFGSERSNEQMKSAMKFDFVKPNTVLVEEG